MGNDPFVSYYWDNECEMGKLGCWADGIHAQCRFCGDYPFTSIACPEGAAPPNGAACAFENEPITPYYWEAGCVMGMHGCNADGVNVRCRFCGGDEYWDIPCPAEQVCAFAQAPTLPYFWDPTCKDGLLGCKADGEHIECRFCGVAPYGPCPTCTFPVEPSTRYVWNNRCNPLTHTTGCFADGIHFECQFCGEDGLDACPSTTGTSTTVTTSTSTYTGSTLAHDHGAPSTSGAQVDTTSLRGGGGGGWDPDSKNGGPWGAAPSVQFAVLLCWLIGTDLRAVLGCA